MPKKLPSRAPGRKSNPKKVSRQSLTKAQGGTYKAGRGGATKATGAPRLRPSTADSQESRTSIMNVPSNPTRGMKGNQGTKTGS